MIKIKKELETKWEKDINSMFLKEGERAKYRIETNWKHYLDYFLKYFYSHIKKDNSKTLLLDIGCRAGLVEKELLKYNFKIYGVDFSIEAIKFAKI